jgi:hypothetical protein
LKRDGTRAETRFGLSAKRMSPFKLAGGGEGGCQFSLLLAAEVCASAVVMVMVMLDKPCSEVECKTTGYPLHSHVSPSLPHASSCAIRFQLSSTTRVGYNAIIIIIIIIIIIAYCN